MVRDSPARELRERRFKWRMSVYHQKLLAERLRENWSALGVPDVATAAVCDCKIDDSLCSLTWLQNFTINRQRGRAQSTGHDPSNSFERPSNPRPHEQPAPRGFDFVESHEIDQRFFNSSQSRVPDAARQVNGIAVVKMDGGTSTAVQASSLRADLKKDQKDFWTKQTVRIR